ncbi:hypothetical protein [Actinocrispum sp. NPDC049592]|uniref:DUF7919 family protein n=1 Tax=Actinocrispum sp. NPDC049592 TaxID=3154835 RepID=UPI003443C122
MAVYEDLSPYEYLPVDHQGAIVNVGWLGKGTPYPSGPVPPGFRDALVRTASGYQTHATRGFHKCPFCGIRRATTAEPVPLLLGHAEFHIPGDQVTYAAPTLVIHYIDEHDYQPPQEFIDAVLALDRPT